MDLAPAIHTDSKSRFHPSIVDEAIYRAVTVQRGVPQAMPAFLGGKCIGITHWEYKTDTVTFTPMTHRQWCGFNGYDDLLINAVGNGQYYRAMFHKDCTGSSDGLSWTDNWPCQGIPGSGAYTGTTNTARQFDNTTTGGLYMGTQPSGGQTKHIVNWQFTTIRSAGTVLNETYIVYDRVLSYDGGSVSSSILNMTNTLPATRYISGGPGLLMVPTCQVGLSTTASNLTSCHYTSASGSTGVAIPTTQALPWFTSISTPSTTTPALIALQSQGGNLSGAPFVPLNGGDSGVQKLEDYTSSATNTGTLSWVLVKPLCTMWCKGMYATVQMDLARSVFSMERILDTACVSFLSIQDDTSSRAFNNGYIGVAWG